MSMMKQWTSASAKADVPRGRNGPAEHAHFGSSAVRPAAYSEAADFLFPSPAANGVEFNGPERK
jgi:hypothetical protein